ncbi:MAG: xylulokinase, partial [Clostridia bacterium]|nr:xylulokinase [Clostridia bacterium]
MNYIGIDLGTSSVKLLLVNSCGEILNEISKEYAVFYPQPGWSEQNPVDWWEAVTEGVAELTSSFDKSLIAGIGCGGQMHGLVALDENDCVIRPAILWNDGRTAEEVEFLNGVIGKDVLSECTANIAFAGFTAPKLLWMKKNEPELFSRIKKIMLPKDYINYMLTGIHCCDYSDASGMLLLDVKNKCWSEKMLDICGVAEEQMPKLFESFEVVGCIKEEIAERFGLKNDVKV